MTYGELIRSRYNTGDMTDREEVIVRHTLCVELRLRFGLTCARTGRLLNMDESTVRYVWKRFGIVEPRAGTKNRRILKMYERIIEIVKRYPSGVSTAVVKNWLRDNYPKITTAEVLRRLKRLREQGKLTLHNTDITKGETYVWYAVDNVT